jgi:hypothetical protein
MAYREKVWNANVLTDLLSTYMSHKAGEREKYYQAELKRKPEKRYPFDTMYPISGSGLPITTQRVGNRTLYAKDGKWEDLTPDIASKYNTDIPKTASKRQPPFKMGDKAYGYKEDGTVDFSEPLHTAEGRLLKPSITTFYNKEDGSQINVTQKDGKFFQTSPGSDKLEEITADELSKYTPKQPNIPSISFKTYYDKTTGESQVYKQTSEGKLLKPKKGVGGEMSEWEELGTDEYFNITDTSPAFKVGEVKTYDIGDKKVSLEYTGKDLDIYTSPSGGERKGWKKVWESDKWKPNNVVGDYMVFKHEGDEIQAIYTGKDSDTVLNLKGTEGWSAVTTTPMYKPDVAYKVGAIRKFNVGDKVIEGEYTANPNDVLDGFKGWKAQETPSSQFKPDPVVDYSKKARDRYKQVIKSYDGIRFPKLQKTISGIKTKDEHDQFVSDLNKGITRFQSSKRETNIATATSTIKGLKEDYTYLGHQMTKMTDEQKYINTDRKVRKKEKTAIQRLLRPYGGQGGKTVYIEEDVDTLREKLINFYERSGEVRQDRKDIINTMPFTEIADYIDNYNELQLQKGGAEMPFYLHRKRFSGHDEAAIFINSLLQGTSSSDALTP